MGGYVRPDGLDRRVRCLRGCHTEGLSPSGSSTAFKEAVLAFYQKDHTMIDTIDLRGWQLKVYTITTGSAVGEDVVAAALSRVVPDLPEVEEPGVGFVIIHHGDQGIWLLCDTWHGDIIIQTVYRADHTAPTDFVAVPRGGPTACVHELEVHNHEARALIDSILVPDEPDTAAYLADTFSLDPADSRNPSG